MRTLAQRLIATEHRDSGHDEVNERAAVRVCEKLGKSLSTLTGRQGFRGLQARALSLAAAEVPWLREFELKETGALQIAKASLDAVSDAEKQRGDVALVAHLLELLSTFIGETLTRDFVQAIWPSSASKKAISERKT